MELLALAAFLLFTFSFVVAALAWLVAKVARWLAMFLAPFAVLAALWKYLRS